MDVRCRSESGPNDPALAMPARSWYSASGDAVQTRRPVELDCRIGERVLRQRQLVAGHGLLAVDVEEQLVDAKYGRPPVSSATPRSSFRSPAWPKR